ncbi:hypothetical protein ACRAWD_05485 [Caulobacter segnis]
MIAPAGQASTLFTELRDDLVSQRGWRQVQSAFNFAVLVNGPQPPEVRPILERFSTEGAVIGRIFSRCADGEDQARRADLEGLGGLDGVEACALLCRETFGPYVAILAKDRLRPTIMRSPDGMVDAFVWRRGPVTLIGDDIPDGMAAPADLAVDWDGVGQVLAQPVRAGGMTPLRGVESIDPGVCRHGDQARAMTRLWSPAIVARRPASRRGWKPFAGPWICPSAPNSTALARSPGGNLRRPGLGGRRRQPGRAWPARGPRGQLLARSG